MLFIPSSHRLMLLVGLFLISFLGLFLPSGAQVTREPVNTVPPAPHGVVKYVTDLADLISPSDEATLQERLSQLDESGAGQIAILTLPRTDRELSEFAPEILNAWGVGHKGKDNGVLILANGERIRQNLSGNRIFVTTGYAAEEILPDGLVGGVLDEQALPAFQQKEYSQGIRDTALTLSGILQGDETLQKQYAPEEDTFGWDDALILLIVLLFFYFSSRHGGVFWIGGGGFGGGSGGSFGGGGFGGGSGGGGGAGR